MIEAQIVLWVMISLAAGLITYYILTEGKNNYLFFMSFFFSLFFGLSTSYLWLQTTNGLAAFSWGLVVLPALFTFVAELFLLSFYTYYHRSKTLPRVPTFTVTRASSTVALVVIFLLSFLLASAYMPVSVDSQSAVSVLGSSQTTVQTVDVTTADIGALPESEITIQNSVVTPLTMRNNPKVGDSLDFKVEFKPSVSYVQPSMVVFVQDSDGNLVDENKIVLWNDAGNVAEGEIVCDEEGMFEITVLVYDLAISGTVPMAASTQSYTVQGLFDVDSGATATTMLFAFSVVFLTVFLVLVAFYKKQ